MTGPHDLEKPTALTSNLESPRAKSRTKASKSRKRKEGDVTEKKTKFRRTNKSEPPAASSAPCVKDHARKIAQYHMLEKRIARASGAEKEALLSEQAQLGGLQLYQQASVHGARHGESSKWLISTLESMHGRRDTRILDIGAIAGTSYAKYTSVDATYIDLNPQASHVIKADFLEFALPDVPYDVICLSLVVNFVGSLEARTEMLRRAQLFVHTQGYLYLVLPRACIANSRYMDTARLQGILQTVGWHVAAQHDSAMLTHWLLCKGPPDSKKWPRREVRRGIQRNNFVVIVK